MQIKTLALLAILQIALAHPVYVVFYIPADM